MSAKTTWILVGLVSLFAGGFAAGVLYQHLSAPPRHEDRRARGHDAAHFLEYFRERLDLADEQATEVNGVLDRLHGDMQELGADFHDRFAALRSRAWMEIRDTLDEQQRPEFEKLVEEMEKEHLRHAQIPGEHAGHRAPNRHQGDSR